MNNTLKHTLKHMLLGVTMVAGLAQVAQAVPSYSRQTGDSCDACHIGSFGPELTTHGLLFKLNGYTDNNGNASIPVSVMVDSGYTHTKKPLSDFPAHYDSNNNAAVQEASLFLAGKLSDHVGMFTQVTYDAVARKAGLDRLDVRYARETNVFGGTKPAIVGVSFNNSPTLSDPFNTLSSWRFPFIESAFANTPAAAPILNGGGGYNMLGLSAYTMLPVGIYLEAGAYRDAPKKGVLNFWYNSDQQPDNWSKGFSPYGRVAYFHQGHGYNYSLGLVGMQSKLKSVSATNDIYDTYTDGGVDGHVQYSINRNNSLSANASYIYEKQRLDATYGAGDATNVKNNLKSTNVSASYYYQNTYGLTLGGFNTTGSADSGLYADSPNNTPNSRGYIGEVSWTPWGRESSWKAPWVNVRLGLQYRGYTQFDGVKTTVANDGSINKASDNNTLLAYVWFAL